MQAGTGNGTFAELTQNEKLLCWSHRFVAVRGTKQKQPNQGKCFMPPSLKKFMECSRMATIHYCNAYLGGKLCIVNLQETRLHSLR